MDLYRVLAGAITQSCMRQNVVFSDDRFWQFLLLLSVTVAEKLSSVNHLVQNLIKIFIF